MKFKSSLVLVSFLRIRECPSVRATLGSLEFSGQHQLTTSLTKGFHFPFADCLSYTFQLRCQSRLPGLPFSPHPLWVTRARRHCALTAKAGGGGAAPTCQFPPVAVWQFVSLVVVFFCPTKFSVFPLSGKDGETVKMLGHVKSKHLCSSQETLPDGLLLSQAYTFH